MISINAGRIGDYLSSIYGKKVKILFLGKLGEKMERPMEKLKVFGYGTPYLIEFEVEKEKMRIVLETVRLGGFGHDHFSDRAQIAIWQHSAFNKLPKHVRSIDVGAFTTDGTLKSLGNCNEYFIITKAVEGKPYARDLDRIKNEKALTQLDRDRCEALSQYLVNIHSVKKASPELYVRRVRDLLGHGEGIMGLCDSYPSGLKYIDESELCNIEKKCVEWRWNIKQRFAHRCSQVHGDFHPWNILFQEGKNFTVLDRSRGEWGDPADDLSAMSINYIFYSLLTNNKFEGPFKAMFDLFWNTYLEETSDEEMFSVIQPFYAWRGLVLASPVWYPNLDEIARMKILNFVRNLLETETFDLKNVSAYMEE